MESVPEVPSAAPFFAMGQQPVANQKSQFSRYIPCSWELFAPPAFVRYRLSHFLKSGTRSVLTNVSSPSARGGWSTTLIRLPE